MIAQLAEMAYRKAGQMFFCVQKDARSVTFSYRRARFAAAVTVVAPRLRAICTTVPKS